ncbi:MAG TPA: hypothetical protein PKI59_08055, partial [Candidatus Cloacimonadota bacterium]|nr:hypothetical protein [Candidatus Cloacimonadota bacterium]
LQKYWFDFFDLALPGYSLHVDLSPSMSSIQSTYLSGTPFIYEGLLESFDFSFSYNNTPIRQLPDEAYIEFGYQSAHSSVTNLKLMTIYRDPKEDWLSYKIPGSAYDAETFTMAHSWIYMSLAKSGTLICGNLDLIGDSFDIPFVKNLQYIQTDAVDVYWNHNGNNTFSKLHLNLSPSGGLQHPWFKGEPFTLGNPLQLAEYSFYRTQNGVMDVPDGFFLALKEVHHVDDLLLFGENHPRIKSYQQSDAVGYSSFTYTNNTLGISPTSSGKLISAVLSTPNPMPVRVFSKMDFIVGDTILYTSGNAPTGASATLNILRRSASNDPYGLLANQYSLVQTSPVMSLNASTSSFYEDFQPAMYFQRKRRNELIVYESSGDFYRFYPYPNGSSLDPWHFVVDSGYK